MALSLAWIDSRPELGETDRLLHRIERECVARQLGLNLIRLEQLDFESLRVADRIVITSHARSDYPHKAIEQLTTAQLGIPWGVVTGHWHSGSRRSGVGVVAHWMQPWYRWWEAWYGWLFPQWARPASLCETQYDAVTLPLDLAMGNRLTSDDMLTETARDGQLSLDVYCACRQTAEAWQAMAEVCGTSVHVQRSLSKPSTLSEPSVNRCSVLWDDSLLSCLPNVDARAQSVQQITQLRKSYANDAHILIGLGLGYLDLWPDLERAGADELFVKPSHGLPLADYLYWARTLLGSYCTGPEPC